LTLNADGNRLIAGNFNQNGLNCNNWNDSIGNDNVGFFLLMVREEKKKAFGLLLLLFKVPN